MEDPNKIIEEMQSLAKKPYSKTKKRLTTLHDVVQKNIEALKARRDKLITPEYEEYLKQKESEPVAAKLFGPGYEDDLPIQTQPNQIGDTLREHKLVSNIFKKWHTGINQPDYKLAKIASKYPNGAGKITNSEFDALANFVDNPASVYKPVQDEFDDLQNRLFESDGTTLKYDYDPRLLHRYTLLRRRLPTHLMSGPIQPEDFDDVMDDLACKNDIYINYRDKINIIDRMPIEEAKANLGVDNPDELYFSNIHKEVTALSGKIEQYDKSFNMLRSLLEGVLTGDLPEGVDESYFERNKSTISESINEQAEQAKSIAESMRNVSKSDPEIQKAIAEIESKANNLTAINKQYIAYGMDKGMALQLNRDMKAIRNAIKMHAPEIMNALAEYEKQTGVERDLEAEIRSLITYKDYLSLPPAVFEHLPESVKRKCRQLEELMNRLNNVKKIKAAIPEQYKLNASNIPTSSDKSSPKVLNPMLNRGYRLFNKVGMHQSMFNKNFN